MGNIVSVGLLKSRRDPLRCPPWNQTWKQDPITPEEIQQALQDPMLDEPNQIWAKHCGAWTRDETASRKSHVYRIAYFVKHREASTPITLKASGSMFDGYHRLAAAIYCGDEFIGVEDSLSAGV
jgi:hypothetical protein